MKANNFTLSSYLERIRFTGTPDADISTLKELMRCQLFSVPFENLDVQAGKVISLVPEEIVEKIIHKRRGGYCYEVNGLFAMALEALGIKYYFVAARPMFYPVRRPKTHMAVLAFVENTTWLCDLGFGSHGIREPINLEALNIDIKQDHDTFRISKTSEQDYLLAALVENEWKNQYEFNLFPHEWIDFAPANYLNSTHPDAVFVQKNLIVLHTPVGRKILLGNTLKTFEENIIIKTEVSKEETNSILLNQFGLTTPQ